MKTIVQYHRQNIDSDLIHKSLFRFPVLHTCLFMCVCMCHSVQAYHMYRFVYLYHSQHKIARKTFITLNWFCLLKTDGFTNQTSSYFTETALCMCKIGIHVSQMTLEPRIRNIKIETLLLEPFMKREFLQ